jgi:aminopeptidase N
MYPRFVYFILLNFLILSAKAQLFDPSSVTRADSLRGTLSPLRTCFDVKYYHLDVKVDPENKTVSGSNTIFFEAVEPFNKIQIDLFSNLTINKILYKGQELKYSREYNAVFIDFPKQIERNGKDSITVYYEGKPIVAQRAPWDGGFVWSKDREGNPWVGVACQGIGASIWWPNKDHLSDEPDSMLISVAVPKGLINVSNGRLRRETQIDENWTKFDWFVSYPINNYNVTVNIAKYAHWSDFHVNGDTLTLDYYVLPANLEKSKKHFEQVKPMMEAFEKYQGKYPFYRDGFKLVETKYLGMEHQTAIAYGNDYKPGYAGSDISRLGLTFDFIILHEAGHEWWGNNVSYSDLADMWISESFCTYSESFYVEEKYGAEIAKKYINAKKPGVGNLEAIAGPYGINHEGHRDMYDKGSLILNTLRYVINNDSLWFDIIKGLQKEFALKSVAKKDIIDYINKRAGKDLNYFFNQYLTTPNLPVLEYKIESKGKRKILSYRWKADVKDFKMPVMVSLESKDKYEYIYPTTAWNEVSLKLPDLNFKVAEDLFYIKVKNITQ